MIDCQDLRKNYGTAAALRGISFRVERGEVVGFLGPNGAGKSTTMKILTGYLLPSGGRATVQGLDVVRDSLAVRKRIGYLPESTPLYTDMRVDEYLRFAASIRGVPRRDVRSAVGKVVESCGLGSVTGKDILELSKGYRQRVGLAQALVHGPDLLILDEPTSGLDPNQIVEVRRLIATLREHHTVILSTHYLQEVEAACSRIVVVDRGQIVADGTRESLIAELEAGSLLLSACGLEAATLRKICGEHLQGTVETTPAGTEPGASARHVARLDVAADATALAVALREAGGTLLELRREEPTLEDAFRALTGGDDAMGARDHEEVSTSA